MDIYILIQLNIYMIYPVQQSRLISLLLFHTIMHMKVRRSD